MHQEWYKVDCGEGEGSQEVHIMQGNPKNKKDLIKLVCSYFQTDKNLFEITLVINSGKRHGELLKKALKSPQHQTLKKLTQG